MKRATLVLVLALVGVSLFSAIAISEEAASQPSATAIKNNPYQPADGFDYKTVLYNVFSPSSKSVGGMTGQIYKDFHAYTKEVYSSALPELTMVYSELAGEALSQDAAKKKIGFVLNVSLPNFRGAVDGEYLASQQMFMMTKSGWKKMFADQPSIPDGAVSYAIKDSWFWANHYGKRPPAKLSFCAAMLQVEYPVKLAPGEKPSPGETLVGIKNYAPFEVDGLKILGMIDNHEVQYVLDKKVRIPAGQSIQIKIGNDKDSMFTKCKAFVAAYGELPERFTDAIKPHVRPDKPPEK